MFEFINRAASMTEAVTVKGLDELMPLIDWKRRLRDAEAFASRDGLSGDGRKEVLVGAFRDSLRAVGQYAYVAEITILRPLRERPIYCLVYGSKNESGIEVFRDCQMKALQTQAEVRAKGKMRATAAKVFRTSFWSQCWIWRQTSSRPGSPTSRIKPSTWCAP